MMIKCQQCGKEFESKGNRAKFCSDACKMQFHRNKRESSNVTDSNVTTPIVTHLAGNPDNPVVDPYPNAAPQPGFTYETVEVERDGVTVTRRKCKGCDEGIHQNARYCATCVKDGKPLEAKMTDKWGSVCTPEEWKRNERGCDLLAEQKAVGDLYDNFSASELAAAGIQPPKWKREFKTRQEAINALQDGLKKDGLVKEEEEVDYSTWK